MTLPPLQTLNVDLLSLQNWTFISQLGINAIRLCFCYFSIKSVFLLNVCTAGAPCEKHRRWTPSGAFFMMELKDCVKSGTCFHSGCRLNRSSYKSITVTSVPGCTWEVHRNWSGSKTFGTMRGNISCHKTSARCSNAELLSQNWSWGNERHRGTKIANLKLFADFHFTVFFLSDMFSSPISF